MAVSNGHAKSANGLSNGNLNMNGKANGNGVANGKPLAHRRPSTKRRGFVASLFSIIARLATWAAILSILFRCPDSLEACDESSPYICKPYFQAKNAVLPHAKPYYDRYAAPYVDVARPYYEAVDNNVLTPTRKYAVQYGGPWAQKAQGYALEQWKETGEPKLDQLRDATHVQYQQSVEPLLQQANAAVGPYVDIVKTNSLQAYYEYLLPGYYLAHPYILQGYHSTAEFTTNSALPAAHWTWNKIYAFVDTAVWPQIRALYLEHVDPQLVRIGERLGRYRTSAKQSPPLGTVPEPSDIKESITSVFSKQSTHESSTVNSAEPEKTETAEAIASKDASAETYENPVQAPPPAENETEKRKKAREMVAHDLELWQNRYAAAADEGAADMEERVSEIAQRKIADDVETNGRSLAKGLTSEVQTQVAILKQKIRDIVANEQADGSAAEEEVTLAVRAAGVAIKDKAQALRAWRETFDKELQETVLRAADVHFQILDDTRGLALQEIGMRWAWTDGVTYKDWAKYHDLKKTLSVWTEQLKQLIVSNPALLEAQDAAAQVEDEAMEVASSAAKELIRLKDVAHYKILANDTSESFDTEAMMLAAEAALAARQAEQAAAKAAEAAASEAADAIAVASSEASARAQDAEDVVREEANEAADTLEEQSTAASQSASSILSGVEEATNEAGEELSESLDSVASEAEGLAGQASSKAADATESVKSVAQGVSNTVESLAATASSSVSSVVNDVEEFASEVADEGQRSVSDASSAISEGGSSVWDEAQSAATEVSAETPEDAQSEKSEAEAAASAMASEASDDIIGQAQTIVGNLTEEPAVDEDANAEEVIEEPLAAREETPASDDNTATVKPAFLGAAAQEVPNRQPILEDYVDTDLLESATKAAADAYSTALSKASAQYSSAVSVVSAQIYGTPKPVHEQLLASVSAAYDFAIAAASTKYDQAVGTPTATASPAMVDWNKVEEIAASRLNEGRLWAELQYQSAVIALGLATPTPSSASDKYLDQAKRNYYAGLGVAQDRYSSFLDAASSVMSSMTATPTPTDFAGRASSAAAAARESAESIAHLAEEAVESAYAAAGDKVASVANAVDESIAGVVDGVTEQAYLAGAAIAETWDNAIAQISGQVYGEQKHLGWYENLFEDASSYVSSATDAVADSASAASDKAEDSAVTASAEAAKQYDAVSQLVSELISGKEPTFSESVLSRLSAAYATAAAGLENYASEASAAAASVGEKVGSAASEATEAVRERIQNARDEL
ncbi:transcription factor hoxa13 [Sarocladium implicatum]|nr:transcription factor hoxa13 [Sarocladium implicatum]